MTASAIYERRMSWRSRIRAAAKTGSGNETSMGDEEKLRRALFAHIEQKSEDVWKSIDDLQKAMKAFSLECSGDGELSARFIELMKRLGDIRHQFQLGLAAIDESHVSTKH